MKTIPLQYVGPHDVVEIAGIPGVVERGAAFEAPEDLAGRGPSVVKEKNDAGEEVGIDDPGEGLLAQTDNFQPATKAQIAALKKAASAENTEES